MVVFKHFKQAQGGNSRFASQRISIKETILKIKRKNCNLDGLDSVLLQFG